MFWGFLYFWFTSVINLNFLIMSKTENPTPAGDLLEKGKSWWESKTIWGAILMLISMGIKTFYPEVDVEGAAGEVADSLPELADGIDSIWSSILGIVGFLVAVYGRIKAKLSIE